jgi:hypothetical protein
VSSLASLRKNTLLHKYTIEDPIALYKVRSYIKCLAFLAGKEYWEEFMQLYCGETHFTVYWKQEVVQSNNLYVIHPFMCYYSYPARGKADNWLVKINIALTKVTFPFALNWEIHFQAFCTHCFHSKNVARKKSSTLLYTLMYSRK